ncbi:RICIN domain-containing protein [Embleya hyalina]|uniref:Beta-xylosidase n=1 Tax=Embleya hyalina TaxID=516124 RepID=A0A401YWW0_9ACTN|nr:RICIN domain-containing protein [Embleya hyalina]GCD99107.1 beta-xylosidase [Embleya hyalina]
MAVSTRDVDSIDPPGGLLPTLALSATLLAAGTLPAMAAEPTAAATPDVVAAAPGFTPLINYHSGKCLDVPGGSTRDGVQVQQWTCNGKAHQRWNLRYARTALGLKLYYVVNEKSGKCLSVKGNSKKNGTPIIQWPCKEGDTAEFFAPLKVNDVPGTNFVLWGAHSGKYPQVDGGSQANGAKVSLWEGKSGRHHYYWRFG